MKEAFELIKKRLEDTEKKLLDASGDIGCTMGIINAMERARRIVNQVAEEFGSDINVLSNDGWISCSERLPERSGYYLCQRGRNNRYFQICGFAKNLVKVDKYEFKGEKRAGFYDYDSEYGYYEVTGIIAWQPLPEPYKPKGE